MAYTSKQKAIDVAKGAGAGAAINGAVLGTVAIAAKAIPIVAKVAGVMMSAPVAATVFGGMAVIGATRAYAKTGNASDAATGAVAGSFGIFPAFETKPVPKTNEARIILASDDGSSLNQMKNDEGKIARANRNLARVERDLKRVGSDPSGPNDAPKASDVPKPAEAAQSFSQRMIAKAEHAIEGAIFGHDKPKDVVDPFDQRRSVVQNKLKTLNKELSTEVGRGGVGPKTKSLEDSITSSSGELTAIDKEERDANAAQSQFYRSAGAAGAGILVGGMIGGAIKKSAVASVQAIEASLAKTAAIAGKAAAANPKGVIRGTLEGDKAAAAVKTAKTTMSSPVVSAGEAYAVPAVTGGQGVIAYGVAEHLDSEAAKRNEGPNAMAAMLRTEATMSMALAGFAGKGAAAARSLRATVSPTNAAKLASAENRMVREARGGPAPVAQSKANAQASAARGVAGVANVQAKRNTEVARLMGQASIERAGVKAKASVEVAKVEGATKVLVSGHDGAANVARATNRAARVETNAPSRRTYKTGKEHTAAEIAAYEKRSVRGKAAYGAQRVNPKTPVNDNASTMARNGFKAKGT